MIRLKSSWLFYALLLIAHQAFGYSLNFQDENMTTKWSHPEISLYINPTHDQNISEESTLLIINKSITEWNLSSPKVNLKTVYDSNISPRENKNDIYFSKDSPYLGPSVAGVTVTIHDQKTGLLIESDIIINDNLTISSNNTDQNFLGNIVTHEVGHLLGLGHSGVRGSSMFYRLNHHQSILHSDDKAGIKAVYPYEDKSLGSLEGRIIGGSEYIGVFGSHVSAVSLNSGKIIAAVITDSKGYFKIEGLPVGDQYFVYVDRLKGRENFSDHYSAAKSDFCNSRFSYRGSFFQSCFSKDEGFPQAIELTSSSRHRDIGSITIRCNLDVPPDYIAHKPQGEMEIIPPGLSVGPSNLGEAFVGFFTQSQAQNQEGDRIRIDLSAVDLKDRHGERDYYLKLRVSNQDFYSALHLKAEVERINGESFRIPELDQENFEQVHFDERGRPATDLVAYLPLSHLDSHDNIFDIKMIPTPLEDFVSTRSVTLEDYLPAFATYGEDLLFYLFTVEVVEKISGASFQTVSRKYYGPIRDNLQCSDAGHAYDISAPTVAPNVLPTGRSPAGRGQKSQGIDAAGCGMILLVNDQSGPPSGGANPMTLIPFFILTLAMLHIYKICIKMGWFPSSLDS